MQTTSPSNLVHQPMDSNLDHPFLPTATAYFNGPTGAIRVSSVNGFVCEIHFCDGNEEVLLNGSLPPEIEMCKSQLEEYFDGRRTTFTFPFKQSGTAFQQRVWNELAKLPFGKTINYQQLAARLGDPKVIRAAASANGRNQLAIVIPCHRVIGSNGDLIGYAGGLPNKRWLLAHEAKHFSGVQTLF